MVKKTGITELPILLEASKANGYGLSNELIFLRNNASKIIRKVQADSIFQLVSCDSILGYAATILAILREKGNSIPSELCEILQEEFIICIIDVSYIYLEISVETMCNAYTSESKDSLWGTSGTYLKYGLGLLDFLLEEWNGFDSTHIKQDYYDLVLSMQSEYKIIQQLGIVVLTLSKLRNKMYKNSKEAVLDFQTEDITDLSKNSVFYSKLIIGCIDCAKNLPTSKHINANSILYLEALTFLLLSMNQFEKDECGISIGMIEESFERMSKFISSSKLNNSVLLKSRKRDKIKTIFKSKDTSTDSKMLEFDKNSKLNKIFQNQLPIGSQKKLTPLLLITVDDFLIPLSTLLYYRYKKTNDKLSFKPIINNTNELMSYWPTGKAPALLGSHWYFDGKIISQTTQAFNTTQNSTEGTYF